ncbi:MAG TPA: isochorismatase family cysteine hydrolase [Candidatus Saccharimonadales bacterium]|nr:isochorismatase family cysteine hydrolase [Candidatus Saccharimonadales bacterium]
MTTPKTALIVIDVQNYFVSRKNGEIPRRIAAHIKASHYDYVLFSKFANQPGSNFERILGWDKCTDPPDTDIAAALAEFTSPQTVFTKPTKSAFKSAELVNFLRTHQVSQIDLCGLDIDDCLLASAFEAFDLGYDFKVLEDLCAISHETDEAYDAALKIIRKNLSRADKTEG